MKLAYTDFDGNEHEVEADVTIETHGEAINQSLRWEERLIVVRVHGKIVARKGLDYREVAQ